MVLLRSYFLHESDPRRDHQQIVLYSFCRSHKMPSFMVKILLKSFCMKIWARWPYIHLLVTSRMPAGLHLLMQPILLSENIPNIWHKSSTKHKEAGTIETIKTIMQTTYLVSHGRFYQWLRLPFLKKYSIIWKRFRLWIVLSWTKTSQRSHYIYYLSHR